MVRNLASSEVCTNEPVPLWGICTIFLHKYPNVGRGKVGIMRPLITATYSCNEWVSLIEVSGGRVELDFT